MSQLSDTLIQIIRVRSAAGSSEEKFRRFAWSMHEKMGWPTRKTETWRYTSCATLMNVPFDLAPPVPALSVLETTKVKDWSRQFDVVVLKNGHFVSGARAKTLSWDFAKTLKPQWEDGFAPAMAAAAQGGFYLEIGKGSSSKPILIAHFYDERGTARSSLNFIEVKAGAQATLLEVWDGSGSGLSSAQTFIRVAESAQLKYARLAQPQPQMRQYVDTQVDVARQAEFRFLNVHLGAQWSRSAITTTLSGEGAAAHLSGISFGSGQEHGDQRVQVRHLAPHTLSRQLFKGIWRDRARGVINGKIYIAPRAQKVDSSQFNHNLLLSSLAEVDTKPELEVYADDVKANHGASLGRLDEEMLFYFISRGISHAQAVQLLSEGFVKDALMKLSDKTLQNWIFAEIQKCGGVE